MDEEFIGAIKLVAFNYDPECFMACDGRLLNVTQYQALYALIGNNFGGEMGKTFALPKLDAPMKGTHYIICIVGIWPPRAN